MSTGQVTRDIHKSVQALFNSINLESTLWESQIETFLCYGKSMDPTSEKKIVLMNF